MIRKAIIEGAPGVYKGVEKRILMVNNEIKRENN